MEIREITEANIDDYRKFAESDESENVGRPCYKGLIAYEKKDAKGCILWSVKDMYDNNASEEICFLEADSDSVYGELIDNHEKTCEEDEIRKSFLESEDISSAVQKKFSDLGFSFNKVESRDLIITVGDLQNSKIPKLKLAKYVKSVGSLDELEFWNGITYCLYHGRKGLIEDLDTLAVDWYEPELSCVVMTDDWIEGLLLIHKTKNGILMPVLLFCNGRDNQKNLLFMIRHAISAAEKNYPPETKILLRRHDDPTNKLMAYFFPSKKGKTVITGKREVKK